MTRRRAATLSIAAAISAGLWSSPAVAEEGPAYALRLEIDLPILALDASLAAIPIVRPETPPPWCAPKCDPARINALDRAVAGVYRLGWARVSDVGVGALVATDVAAMLLDEGPLNALNDAVVVAQTILSAETLAAWTSMIVRRPRPYLYGEDAPLDERQNPYGAMSFFSGHSTTAFAAAVVLQRTLARRHPGSPVPNLVLASTLTVAGLVAVGRVASGNHFPTDVTVGAVVGSSMGVLVPALHGPGMALAPFAGPGTAGIGLRGAW
jgi:membrane-associated phospholipid phosphatase